MQYEYDPKKSATNLVKHGIDFEEAQALWEDPYAIIADARSEAEMRFFVTGRIGDVLWTAIITYRGEAIRIISVRRARTYEVHHYEEAKNY